MHPSQDLHRDFEVALKLYVCLWWGTEDVDLDWSFSILEGRVTILEKDLSSRKSTSSDLIILLCNEGSLRYQSWKSCGCPSLQRISEKTKSYSQAVCVLLMSASHDCELTSIFIWWCLMTRDIIHHKIHWWESDEQHNNLYVIIITLMGHQWYIHKTLMVSLQGMTTRVNEGESKRCGC